MVEFGDINANVNHSVLLSWTDTVLSNNDYPRRLDRHISTQCDKKGDSSTLKNMRVDNIRGEEDSTLYSYYILDGENVIRITASSMEGENIKDTKENLSEFKTFLRTIKVK